MAQNNLIECSPRNGWMGWCPNLSAVYDPENGRIREFLIEEERKLQPQSLVLDASAGKKPYKDIFENHRYESCDIPGGFYAERHDFECFLDAIPKPNDYYDVVLLTQVLEHVPIPVDVLEEIKRILKPKGKLLISVPLNGPLHGEPWHFFQFTHYGLNELSKRHEFKISAIEKIGGAFWFFGKHLQDLPKKIMKSFDPFRARRRGRSAGLCFLLTLVFFPIWACSLLLLSGLLRPLCYWLDVLDTEKTMTLGYTAVFEKKSFSK